MGKHPLPGYGPVTHGNRLVRTRMPGGVGAGGEIPPATRLGSYYPKESLPCIWFDVFTRFTGFRNDPELLTPCVS